MNCHPERSEEPAVCGEQHISSTVRHEKVWRTGHRTSTSHVRYWLFTAIAIIVLGLPLTAQAQNKTAPVTKSPGAPAEDPQLYRNPTFGFRYQIPYGWVDRTREMLERNEAGKSQLLLAVFERPPEATGDTINSAVVIASESSGVLPRPQASRRLRRPAHRTRDLQRLQARRRSL